MDMLAPSSWKCSSKILRNADSVLSMSSWISLIAQYCLDHDSKMTIKIPWRLVQDLLGLSKRVHTLFIWIHKVLIHCECSNKKGESNWSFNNPVWWLKWLSLYIACISYLVPSLQSHLSSTNKSGFDQSACFLIHYSCHRGFIFLQYEIKKN